MVLAVEDYAEGSNMSEQERELLLIRKSFNKRHKCYEDVTNSPSVSFSHYFDPLSAAYGNVMLPENIFLNSC